MKFLSVFAFVLMVGAVFFFTEAKAVAQNNQGDTTCPCMTKADFTNAIGVFEDDDFFFVETPTGGAAMFVASPFLDRKVACEIESEQEIVKVLTQSQVNACISLINNLCPQVHNICVPDPDPNNPPICHGECGPVQL